ncbi:ankyrin repeat-containing domain protein [Tuber borchii]|uniref:Ankyrin repeat-containing domain protein n=1 Tax=Tuber borchii TaxID=42251 RepID=A0A2T7A2K5_TUBBO|nr:ankyrin repeat-containing domain protein [Tuber borchii]
MDLIRFPAELQLLIAEKLESRELSYLCCANHYFHSLCTPVLERLAQEPRKRLCALEWAIMSNRLPLIQLLLSKGHDINHLGRGSCFATALHVAVSCRNHPLILLFLENPALDLNKLDIDGNTALHIAIRCRDLEVVKLLHTAGVDLEIPDKRGRTALLLALHDCNVRIIEFLVRNRANVNARLPAGIWLDVTLLHGLMWPKCERLVRLALEHGADPEVRDDDDWRPIDLAFVRGFTGIVDILREVSLPLDMDAESDPETVWNDASRG